SGEVTFNKKVVPGGTVTLWPQKGSPYTLHIQSDGTYSGTDLPVGEMLVTIETESASTEGKKQEYGEGGHRMRMSPPPGGGTGDKRKSGGYVKIRDKYSNKNRPGLKVSLEPGAQTKNFDLTN